MSSSPERIRERNKDTIKFTLSRAKGRKLRWSHLLEKTKLSRRTLSLRLKELEKENVIERVVDATSKAYPPPVFYILKQDYPITSKDIFLNDLSKQLEMSEQDIIKAKEIFTDALVKCLFDCALLVSQHKRIRLTLDGASLFVPISPCKGSSISQSSPIKQMSNNLADMLSDSLELSIDWGNDFLGSDKEKWEKISGLEAPKGKTIVSAKENPQIYLRYGKNFLNIITIHYVLSIYELEKKNKNSFDGLTSALIISPYVKSCNIDKDFQTLLGWWKNLKIFGSYFLHKVAAQTLDNQLKSVLLQKILNDTFSQIEQVINSKKEEEKINRGQIKNEINSKFQELRKVHKIKYYGQTGTILM